MPSQQNDNGLSFVQLGAMLGARKYLIGATVVLSVVLTGLATSMLPKTYTASAELYIDYRASDPIAGRQFHPMLDESYMQTQFDILKSEDVTRHVIDATRMLDTPKARESIQKLGEAVVKSGLVAEISKSLEVVPRRTSRVLELKYSSNDPLLARDALNAAIKGYIEITTNISAAPAKSRQEQYNTQLVSLRQEIDRIQRELTEYQQKAGILDADERLDTGSRQFNEMATRLLVVQASQTEAGSKKRAIHSMIAAGTPPAEVPDIAKHEGIRELKLRLVEINSRIAEVSGVLGKNHPKFRALEADRDAVSKLLDREARNVLRAMEMEDQKFGDQAARLDADMRNRQKQLLEMKKHRDVIGSYQRQLASVQQIYNSAVQKYDEILMASNVNSPTLAVLRWAEKPYRHSKPLMSNNLLFSVPSGLILGLLFALLIEMANRRIRCVEDLEHSLALPVLGGAAS